MKKILASLILLSFLYSFSLQNLHWFSNSAEAQVASKSKSCLNLAFNQTLGSRDSKTEGEVTKLQDFLNQIGLLNHIPTGYFGVLTRAALAQYQTQNNIYPNLGYLGPLTRASLNQNTCNQYIPSTPSGQASYYCDVNGITYQSESAYLNNCVQITYSYFCSTNGQTYTNQRDYQNYCNFNPNPMPPSPTTYYCFLNNLTYYDLATYQANCKSPQPTIYYCALNGQNYYTQNDYNQYCRSASSLPICNLGVTYTNTQTCVCPSGYSFLAVGNGYKCDNGNYACTLIYVPPYATSSSYDRCHYAYYCPLDNLYHNSLGYCQTPNANICELNKTYQGGGIVATNDCTCPPGSTRINTGNYGEIYTWICRP